MSTPNQPASADEANRPPSTLPWQDAVQELMVQNLGPMQAQEVVRRACEQWARSATEHWRQHDQHMHGTLAMIVSERDTLLAQLDLCRGVLEEVRPIVKARLIDMDDLRAPLCDGSILDRIESALSGAPVPDELAATKARLDVARTALERLATGHHVGTSINKGCGAMMLIEEALAALDAPAPGGKEPVV